MEGPVYQFCIYYCTSKTFSKQINHIPTLYSNTGSISTDEDFLIPV